MSIKSDQLNKPSSTVGTSNTFIGYVPDGHRFFTSWSEADEWAREYSPGTDPVNVRVAYFRAISGGITIISHELDWPKGQQALFKDSVGSITKILEAVLIKKLGVTTRRKGKK